MPGFLVLGIGLVLALLIGWLDYLTGPDIPLALVQLIPILLAAWVGGKKTGLALAIFCAGTSLWVGLSSGQPSSNPLISVWNSILLLGVFLLFAHLISMLRSHLKIEGRLATTDTLTGALNNRGFYDVAKVELDRARRYRHPFTVAYIDLDNFKEINDTFGHSIGDAVLRTVSKTISTNIRTADILARLGGDEFALLLPETGAEEAQALLPRLHQLVTEELAKGSWALSVSMGATIFMSYPLRVDDLIHMADQAMYKGKRDNKAAIQFTLYKEEVEA